MFYHILIDKLVPTPFDNPLLRNKNLKFCLLGKKGDKNGRKREK